MSTIPPEGALRANAVGVPGVVFMVLAAVAPMAAVVAIVPLGIAFGNGGGMPGAVLIVGVCLGCFAVGYVAMSRHVVNAGAFYAYISRGLGRPLGIAAAAVAVVSYPAMALSVTGAFGFFGGLTFSSQLGFDAPWYLWSLLLIAAVGVFGYLKIDLSARILGVALVLEMVAILTVDAGIVVHHGLAAIPRAALSPSTVLGAAPGIALLYGFTLFVGFEATAIFGEESRDPLRTVGRATYTAIFIIAAFYMLTAWLMIGNFGVEEVRGVAAGDPGALIFAAAEANVGRWLVVIMEWLMLSSAAAAVLALHNSAARYLFALGRVRLLPRPLGRAQRRFGSPHIASMTLSVIEVSVLLVCALAAVEPYLQLAALASALATFGIILLQAGAATSVVGFFWRRPGRSRIRTIILPGIGAAGLLGACVLIVHNFPALTGRPSGVVNQIPWMVVGLAAVALGYGLWLRRYRSERYDTIARALETGGRSLHEDHRHGEKSGSG